MLVTQIMTPNPRTIRADDPVDDALELLHALDVRHLPVVSAGGELVGMLSERDLILFGRDLLRSSTIFAEGDVDVEEVDQEFLVRRRTPVSAVMTTYAIHVDVHATLTDVIERMIDNKIGALPVVDAENRPIGIVSYVDILRLVTEHEDALEQRRVA